MVPSDPDNQGIVGQKSTDTRILRIIATGQSDNEEMIDRETGKRIWVLASPVKSKWRGYWCHLFCIKNRKCIWPNETN